MVEITGTRVRLRSLTLDDVDALTAAADAEPASFGRGNAAADRIRGQIERNPTLADGGFLGLGVEHDGVLVGDIQARSPKHGFPPGVCEIGITLFENARGLGVGKEAVALFTEHLFSEGLERIQATTAVDNVAMRRVLEIAGYTFEGVLAAYAPGDSGGRDDYAMYAVTAPR